MCRTKIIINDMKIVESLKRINESLIKIEIDCSAIIIKYGELIIKTIIMKYDKIVHAFIQSLNFNEKINFLTYIKNRIINRIKNEINIINSNDNNILFNDFQVLFEYVKIKCEYKLRNYKISFVLNKNSCKLNLKINKFKIKNLDFIINTNEILYNNSLLYRIIINLHNDTQKLNPVFLYKEKEEQLNQTIYEYMNQLKSNIKNDLKEYNNTNFNIVNHSFNKYFDYVKCDDEYKFTFKLNQIENKIIKVHILIEKLNIML